MALSTLGLIPSRGRCGGTACRPLGSESDWESRVSWPLDSESDGRRGRPGPGFLHSSIQTQSPRCTLRRRRQKKATGIEPAARCSAQGAISKELDLPIPNAPAWFTPRGRPFSPTSSDCYHRAGGGPLPAGGASMAAGPARAAARASRERRHRRRGCHTWSAYPGRISPRTAGAPRCRRGRANLLPGEAHDT